MSDICYSTQFYFEIEQIMTTHPETTETGLWRPSSHPTGHQRYGVPLKFFFDGQRARHISELPHGLVTHRVHTMYCIPDTMFWIAPEDAMNPAINNEDDDNDDDDDDESDTPTVDWRWLTFNEMPNDQTFAVYAKVRQPLLTLRAQRLDQSWVYSLLPPNYHAGLVENPLLGGMVGDLPILIGLLVMALPENPIEIARELPTMVTHDVNYRPNWQAPFPQRGWRLGRGVVVSIYYDPSRWQAAHLEAYERGAYGKIFR